MIKTTLTSLIAGLTLFPTFSYAGNPCAGKADYEVRLDQPGKSLENSEVVDQDGTGVCYAAASATMLQSVLPGNPDISYLDYALQFKKAENQNKPTKIVTDTKNDVTLLDGGSPCEHFSSIKKVGVCPREKVELEMLNSSDPYMQIDSLEGIGHYFDVQKKLTPEKRKKANEAIAKALDQVRAGGKEECNQFPTAMRALLKNVYLEVEKQINDLKFDLKLNRPKAEIESSIAKYQLKKESQLEEIKVIESTKANLIQNHQQRMEKLEGRKDSPFYAVIRKKNEKKIQEELNQFKSTMAKIELQQKVASSSLETISNIIKYEHDDLKKVQDIETKIVNTEKTLSSMGQKVPNPNSKVANTFVVQLSDELEKKLQSEYRNTISKVEPNEYKWDEFQKPAEGFIASLGVALTPSVQMAILEADTLDEDYEQLEPNRCVNFYLKKNNDVLTAQLKKDMTCADPNLSGPAMELIKSLNAQINANINSVDILNKLSETPYEFIEEIMGSKCTTKDRIKIPASLTCVKRETFDMIWDAPGSPSFDSPKAYSIVSNQFNSDSMKSINKGRSLYIGVCADMFDSTSADSGFGRSCLSGGHAVSMVGYRCKNGAINYLLQNSWGSSNPPYGSSVEASNGRIWVPEKLLIKNLRRYGMIEGNIK